MAKIIIVDKDDNPIDLKEREIFHPTNDICRVSTLWLSNSKNQILLAQRNLNRKYHAGQWGPAVGGTNEEGETYETNIYKEAEEEIGLSTKNFSLGPKLFFDNPYKTFCQVFLFSLDWPLKKFKIQEEEVEQIKWFYKKRLLKELEENQNNYTEAVHNIIKNNQD